MTCGGENSTRGKASVSRSERAIDQVKRGSSHDPLSSPSLFETKNAAQYAHDLRTEHQEKLFASDDGNSRTLESISRSKVDSKNNIADMFQD